MGSEYDLAKSNIQSKTLNSLSNMKSWERVKEQAIKGHIKVTGEYGTRIESEYPIRACSTFGNRMLVKVEGAPLGFVPVVVCGLTSSYVSSGVGLWVQPGGTSNYTLESQGNAAVGGNDFWQANYDRATETYEIVYNIEITASFTMIAFGTHPDSWPEYPKENQNNHGKNKTNISKDQDELTGDSSGCLHGPFSASYIFIAVLCGGLLLFTTSF